MQIIHTFSIRSKDTELVKLVDNVKKDCLKTGTTFSYVILKALKKYYDRG